MSPWDTRLIHMFVWSVVNTRSRWSRPASVIRVDVRRMKLGWNESWLTIRIPSLATAVCLPNLKWMRSWKCPCISKKAELHTEWLLVAEWIDAATVSISSQWGCWWKLIKSKFRSFCESGFGLQRWTSTLVKTAQSHWGKSKTECINDGVGQCDSVHHASLSSEERPCHPVRETRPRYNSFL